MQITVYTNRIKNMSDVINNARNRKLLKYHVHCSVHKSPLLVPTWSQLHL